MGISPSELEDITPYEFNLLREGYNRQLGIIQQVEWERSKMIAYTYYVMQAGGEDAVSMEEFFRPADEQNKKNIKDAVKVRVKEKADLEAKMNKIPWGKLSAGQI